MALATFSKRWNGVSWSPSLSLVVRGAFAQRGFSVAHDVNFAKVLGERLLQAQRTAGDVKLSTQNVEASAA